MIYVALIFCLLCNIINFVLCGLMIEHYNSFYKKYKKSVNELRAADDILAASINDDHTTIQKDYYNHMRDMNEINKKIIKIERRLDHEN